MRHLPRRCSPVTAAWIAILASCSQGPDGGESLGDAAGHEDAFDDDTPSEVDTDVGDAADHDDVGHAFVPWLPDDDAADVRTDRLCAESDAPDEAADTVQIDCRLEGANLAPDDAPPTDAPTVMTWNVERGIHLDDQLTLLLDDPRVPRPDILLASELDRGCSRSAYRDVAREYAEALKMNYVFAVEFVELPRPDGPGGTIEAPCEHGNAIFSRFPIGNVGTLRHADNRDWYLPPGERDDAEPRLGGRIDVFADVRVGDRTLHVVSVHYESNPFFEQDQRNQALGTAEQAAAQPHPVVVGGDTNNGTYFVDLQQGTRTDPTVERFFERGFEDAHAGLPWDERGTRGGLVIDLLFGLGVAFSDPALCPAEACDPLSDHRAVWATVEIGERD